MADAPWLVEQVCPQCDTPIRFTEQDCLLACQGCHVRLYAATGDARRFVIPPKNPEVGEIVMVPYWRVRGHAFDGINLRIQGRVLDLTRLACVAPGLPPTLAARDTAGSPLRLAGPGLAGRFLATCGPDPTQAGAAELRSPTRHEDDEWFFTIPMVTLRTVVYAPVRLAHGVFDAVQSRRLDLMSADEWLARTESQGGAPPAVRLLATLCPACGEQLDGQPESLVVHCSRCRTAWCGAGSGLYEQPYSVLSSGTWHPGAYLPFWRIQAEWEGAELMSRADLVRFAKLPTGSRREWEEQPATFWIPATPVPPDHLLRFARTLTIARSDRLVETRGGGGGLARGVALLPMTLPASCLADAVKVLAAELAQPRLPFFGRVQELRVAVSRQELVYVPLIARGSELSNPDLGLSLHRSLLKR